MALSITCCLTEAARAGAVEAVVIDLGRAGGLEGGRGHRFTSSNRRNVVTLGSVTVRPVSPMPPSLVRRPRRPAESFTLLSEPGTSNEVPVPARMPVPGRQGRQLPLRRVGDSQQLVM